MAAQHGDVDDAVEQWRIKNLIKSLSNARGNGTSMISLIVRPGDQLPNVTQLLNDEYGTASNIKSRVNRLSVLSAITSAQQRLKLYNRIPDNGLVIYCGTITTADNKEKKLNIDFEPFKPINTSLYLCDNKFHTEPLNELLESDNTFGFIVMDGNGALFGTVSGNTRTVLHKFTVELPKKHGRGGQSAMRFARLRLEKRHNYLRKVAETSTQMFIQDDKPTVKGLILAGSAMFKNDLAATDMFDGRLKELVIQIVDVSYGGENGFNQAIELSADALANVKFVHEKRLLTEFMSQIAQDTGKYCFGVGDTMKALEQGAVETLIIWEDLAMTRYSVRNPTTGEEDIMVLTDEQAQSPDRFFDKATGVALEIVDKEDFLEWISLHYKDFGAHLEFVSNRSEEGSQFEKGFSGVGGLLRYALDFLAMAEPDEFYDDDDFL
jgi:peptide chain release factor subunit 1